MYAESVRDVVRKMRVYERDSFKNAGLFEKPAFLDANENYFIEEDWLREKLMRVLQITDLRTYPDPYSSTCARKIAEFLKVSEKNILVGSGSDQFIDVVVKTFVDKGEEVIYHEPTFGMYKFFVNLGGGKTKPILLKPDFSLDVDSILGAITKRTKIIFVCSPNNPTGNQFPYADVQRIIRGSERLVVVDEAYVDFARYSILEMIGRYDNVMTFRTFSKAYGLPALRIGYVVASSEVVNYLKKCLPPYSVNALAQNVVGTILESWNYIKEKIEEIKGERERLFLELSKIDGLRPFPSDANFILTKIERKGYSSKMVKEELAKQGIFVREVSSSRCENCLRITVGTPQMNDKLIEALRIIFGGMT